MRKFLDTLYLLAGGIAALCICAICALMIGQSVLREFGIKTGAVNDVVAWLCAAAAFLKIKIKKSCIRDLEEMLLYLYPDMIYVLILHYMCPIHTLL